MRPGRSAGDLENIRDPERNAGCNDIFRQSA